MATNENNYIGVAMGLDVTDLKAGLREANKQIQLANSEFKAAASGMDDWTKSTEGLQAKVKQLDTVLKMQQAKLAGLNAEYEETVKKQGENSEAARKLKVQINNQQAIVNSTQKEFKNYTETLEGVENGSIDLEKVSLRAGKAVEQAGRQAEDAGDGFTVAKGAIAGFISNGLTALVGAAKDGITTLLGLSDATREYRQTLATLDTAAEDVGVNTDFMRDKFTDLMGVFDDGDSVTEGLNNLLTAGFNEKTLDGITSSLEGAALKWKDTLSFEGLADSLQEWIGSGGESLTGNFAELLERMGYNLEEVTEKTAGMTDEQRRNYAANLLASEGLNDVSESYRTQNADMVAAKQANVDYQNAVAAAGEKIEPITTKIREGFTQIINKVLELVGGTDLESFGVQIDSAFNKFTEEMLPKIVAGLQWLIDNSDGIIAGITGIGAAFLAWKVVSIVQGIIKAFNAWKLATEGLTIAQRLLNLVMKANPIGIVISLIIGLVTAFVTLWNKSEAFRNFWINLWEGIKNACSVAWEAISGFFTNAFTKMKENWGKAKSFFSDLWTGIKKGASDAWNGIKSVFSKVGSFFGGIWDTIKSKFTSIGTKIGDAIGGAFKTAINAVLATVESGINSVPRAVNKALDAINKLPGVSIGKMSEISLPRLAKGGILKRGQVGLLEGDGTEAVVPLEKNIGWIRKIANELSRNLGFDVSAAKRGLSAGLVTSGTSGNRGGKTESKTVNVDARMNLQYNGNMSLKEVKQREREHYVAVRTKLKAEGLI